jgi:hypothetical protein
MGVIEREDVIDDAMHEIAMRVQDADGEPMDPAWRREFAEAVVGRLADELVGALGALEKIAILAAARGGRTDEERVQVLADIHLIAKQGGH